MSRSRWMWVLGAGFVVLVAIGVGQCAGILPEKTRTERQGRFEVVYRTYDVLGHRGTRRTLYYRGDSFRRVLIQKNVGGFVIDPYDPDRVLLDYCAGENSPDCGTFFFDGHNRRKLKVSGERFMHYSARDDAISWPPDKKLLVLTSEYQVAVVNLETGKSEQLGDVLELEKGRRWVRPAGRSSDLRKYAVLIGEYLPNAPTTARVTEDLVVIDFKDNSAWYVATSQPRGWDRRFFHWTPGPDGYTMYAAPNRDTPDWQVYRKQAGQLPPGMLAQ